MGRWSAESYTSIRKRLRISQNCCRAVTYIRGSGRYQVLLPPFGNMPTGRRVLGSPVRPPVECGDSVGFTACRNRAACRPRIGHGESVVPGCHHVRVFIGTGPVRRSNRTGHRELPSIDRRKYPAHPNRVVGYAGPPRVPRAMIETVASRTGNPEHRPNRDAAFCVPAAARTPDKADEIVGAQDNTDSGIGRISDPATSLRRPHDGRRWKFDIAKSRTSGESCPTQ